MSLSKPKRLSPNTLSTCNIDDCTRPAVCRHMCATHYSKFKKYGDPRAGRVNDGRRKAEKQDASLRYASRVKNADKKCVIDNCNDPVYVKGLCRFHDDRKKRYDDPLMGGVRVRRDGKTLPCLVDGCDKVPSAHGYCAKHLAKFRKYGDPLGGKNKADIKAEWRLNPNGYVIRSCFSSPHASGNTVFQHRQVMGEHIGRPLLPIENVHHKNGNRADNRLENLELWSKAQPAGQRVVDKVKFAREIIDLYGHLDIV